MATQYYRYNVLTRVLTAEPRYIVTLDGSTIVNPTAEQYADLRDAYPKGEDAPMPEPQEGKVPIPDGYAFSGGAWVRQWKFMDAIAPKTFSVRSVDDIVDTVRALAESAGMVELSEGDE